MAKLQLMPQACLSFNLRDGDEKAQRQEAERIYEAVTVAVNAAISGMRATGAITFRGIFIGDHGPSPVPSATSR
jgi:hypothetical protein